MSKKAIGILVGVILVLGLLVGSASAGSYGHVLSSLSMVSK